MKPFHPGHRGRRARHECFWTVGTTDQFHFHGEFSRRLWQIIHEFRNEFNYQVNLVLRKPTVILRAPSTTSNAYVGPTRRTIDVGRKGRLTGCVVRSTIGWSARILTCDPRTTKAVPCNSASFGQQGAQAKLALLTKPPMHFYRRPVRLDQDNRRLAKDPPSGRDLVE